MALGYTLLRLLVIVLGFSCIIGSNAVPATRTKSLMHENHASFQSSMKKSDMEANEAMQEGKIMERKLGNIELEDYPGSGANNRHTPRPQFRGCDDC